MSQSNGVQSKDPAMEHTPPPDVEQSKVDTSMLRSDAHQMSENFGRISLENAGTSYTDGAHWSAILDGVLLSISHDASNLHRSIVDVSLSDCRAQGLFPR